MTPTTHEVELLARMAGLKIDPAYFPSVTANLAILAQQAALLFDPPMSPLVEPAAIYRP